MRSPLLAKAIAFLCGAGLLCTADGSPPSPTPPRGKSAARLREAARTVRVMTGILGVELGSSLESAHAKLDGLTDSGKGKEERDLRGNFRALWEPRETDYRAIYVKADKQRMIEQITGFLRPEKMMPFERIGETRKAPVYSETGVLWDVLRPDRPQLRVAASGRNNKADLIKIFVVRRRQL